MSTGKQRSHMRAQHTLAQLLWHVSRLENLTAYDEPRDYHPLRAARAIGYLQAYKPLLAQSLFDMLSMKDYAALVTVLQEHIEPN